MWQIEGLKREKKALRWLTVLPAVWFACWLWKISRKRESQISSVDLFFLGFFLFLAIIICRYGRYGTCLLKTFHPCYVYVFKTSLLQCLEGVTCVGGKILPVLVCFTLSLCLYVCLVVCEFLWAQKSSSVTFQVGAWQLCPVSSPTLPFSGLH